MTTPLLFILDVLIWLFGLDKWGELRKESRR